MYNPYNWKIHKENPFYGKVVKPKSECECVLDRLSFTCTELDMVRIYHSDLKKSLEEVERELIRLEDKKLSLIKELAEHP